ncbi:ADP-ribosylation factor-directed GTPase activating protein isoform b [Neorhodopirellula pilleata]|uniref:Uncharacterized protein n=1 Tax=Neorhodopirellula pilleata TaxID=2714738 RepID=A0A5C6AUV2_9BACT|nr:ADP-ribosylation factor-directed GTPase activating protein isoform b [Neorhodopirellula pilleata]TWU03211.1 hypothetical protein Pla100_01290 [Neorhodopirellula pilleata]
MFGCVSTGVMHCDVGSSGVALADNLEWTNTLNPASPSVTTVSQSGRPIDWSQTQTPAQENESEKLKVPSTLPTESVHSVVGIRDVQGANSTSRPAGTTIQLLPPRRDPVPPAAPANSELTLQSPAFSDRVAPTVGASQATPLATPRAARLVTRDDAQILGFRTTWQLDVPSFRQSGQEIVLHVPENESHEDHGHTQNKEIAAHTDAPPAVAQLQAPVAVGSGLPKGLPAKLPADLAESNAERTTESRPSATLPGSLSSLPVGNRQYFPAFMAPTGSQDDSDNEAPQPPSTGPVTGSGLRTPGPDSLYENVLRPEDSSPSQSSLAPIEEMPPLDELVEPEIASSSTPVSPTKIVDEGSNEGDGEASEPTEVEGDVSLPNDLTIEDMLSAGDAKPARLSPTDIKPLKIVIDGPLAEASKLKNAESEIDLKDVQEDKEAQDDIEPLPVGRLSQLDATGRLKLHAEPTALEIIPPTIARLKSPVLRTLQTFHARTENADSRSNWGMMHQIMAYGADTRIIARGRNYSAIAWMAGNNVCRGSRLMTTAGGKIQVREGTGLQGHQAQFLAIMSLVGVPSTYPLYVGNQRFQIKDLVEVEAAACEDGKELTFTLIGLSHYLDTDTTWTGAKGETWDFDRLIAAELSQPIVGAACGGTHRLMSFAHALRKRRLEGQPITGQWKRAEDFLNEFVQYTYSLQNRDGSMSTNWFESPEDNGDLARKVQTTGHMVEFLLTHLPDEELGDIRMSRAITFLVNAMGRIQIDDSAVGYRGHALRSLAMYHRRMYGIAADYPAPSMATQPARSSVRRQR